MASGNDVTVDYESAGKWTFDESGLAEVLYDLTFIFKANGHTFNMTLSIIQKTQKT